MKRLKGLASRRRSFELPIEYPTSDVQTPKLKKISQVMGIDSAPIVSSPRHGGTELGEKQRSENGVEFPSGRVWKNALRGMSSSRGFSFSSASEIPCSSSRLSDASLATSTSGNVPGSVERAGRVVVVAFDANVRDAVVSAVAWAFLHVLKSGDLLALVGVMDYLRGPLGYKSQVDDETWLGANRKHLQAEIALKKLAWAATPGLQTLCEERGVKLVVNVKAAAHPEVVVEREAAAFGALQVVLDRSLKTNPRRRKFYLERLNCAVTRMRRSGGVEILRATASLRHSNSNSPPSPISVTPNRPSQSSQASQSSQSSESRAEASQSSAAAAPAFESEDELFSIDHCVATPTSSHVHRPGDAMDEELGYESDDLFSICDDGAWRTSSFGALLQRPESARNSSVAAYDHDPAMACFVPPRASVEFGQRLDKRLLSLRLQLRD